MGRKLWVPPPPAGDRRDPTHRYAASQRRVRAQRNRSSGCRGVQRAALIVALGILITCLLVVIFPALFALAGGSRVNLLLLGVDRQDGTDWASRTDTIMVFTLEPETGAVGLLSIPRDLHLAIPGYGWDRINTANVYGYLQDYPGGGPALLEATIVANFGIPIDGYLMVNFQAFERIVDTLGGIDVYVPESLHDTRYPDPRPEDPYGFKTLHFERGWQHMDGKRALEYARSRMSTSDFDRAKRQQQILLAIRERALSPGGILRWPLLARAVMDEIKTDMGLGRLLALAISAMRIDTFNLRQVVLEYPLVVDHQRADGAAVQLPNWDLINPVIEELFGSPY
jgi:LCP family protein required for cell wall assembly